MREDIKINEITLKISKGEERAFRQLFDMYYRKLFGIAISYLKDRNEAEEVVADVFFKLWQSKANLVNIENIDVYLYVAIRNQSFKYIERRKRIDYKDELSGDIEVGDFGVNPEQYVFAKELKEHIDMVVDSLPSRCKEIFRLAKIDGLKYKDIAKMLDISVKTIDSQLVIALKKISESIDILKLLPLFMLFF